MARGMLSCAACARRAVLNIHAARSPTTVTSLPFRPNRFYAVEAASNNAKSRRFETRPAAPGRGEVMFEEKGDAPKGKAIASKAEPSASADAPRDLESATSDAAAEDARRLKRSQGLNRAVYAHLRRMDDPWTIGKYVEKALERGAFEEAQIVVEKASRQHQLTVSWNYLIAHLLKMDRIRDAVKLYNDMKKRQQMPNDRTYTIMFRGLAECSNKELAVKTALKHWELLLKNRDRENAVRPNDIHLTAVLKVCARAGDMDALFNITNSMEESKLEATTGTYSVIFNALRFSAKEEMQKLQTDEEKTAKRTELIGVTEGLWDEVCAKWKRGKFALDEALVCSVGRIFLEGTSDAEKMKAASIIRDTMNIPNFMQDPNSTGVGQNMLGIALGKKSPIRTTDGMAKFVIPGTNTLGLLLNAVCATIHSPRQPYVGRRVRAAVNYWNALVQDCQLKPDENNCAGLFHTFRLAGASDWTAKLLESEKFPEHGRSAAVHRMAMQACLNDNANPMVVENSKRIVDSMLQASRIPDLEVLNHHLRVALISSRSFSRQANVEKADLEDQHLRYGQQILKALGDIWEPYRQAHYHYFNGGSRLRNKKAEEKLLSDKADVIFLARRMAAAFHKILREDLVKPEEKQAVENTYAMLQKDIQDFMHNHVPKDMENQAEMSTLTDFDRSDDLKRSVWKTYLKPDAAQKEKKPARMSQRTRRN